MVGMQLPANRFLTSPRSLRNLATNRRRTRPLAGGSTSVPVEELAADYILVTEATLSNL